MATSDINFELKESAPNFEVYLQVQQTPNPFAQDPAEVPPLLVHSELDNSNQVHYRNYRSK